MAHSASFHLIILAAIAWLSSVRIAAADDIGASYKVRDVMPNRLEPPEPGQTKLSGWLGSRVTANASSRLLEVDLEPLLAGFRDKPGSHPWIGEHIGKWMHAASLAWANNRDPRLRKKLDYATAELIKTQEPDGYLGTYEPKERFGLYKGADWDVWSHKYCLIGLLSYYQHTGDTNALAASRKAVDLLIRTFGKEKSILSAGTHMGMAATSVLEPVVLLYRLTEDTRYLQFAKYIVSAWSEPGGPKLIESLTGAGMVNKTANAKAYEMLSNLVGACDLAQVTGDTNLLRIAVQAVQDIRDKRLYLTGGTSQGEHFREDHHLPNDTSAHVAETCVTVTWIQLNSRLLQMTGEAVYGENLEQTFFNHLTAAQHPGGKEWCYFTPLAGIKNYGPGISCCVSSGPRGVSLIPQHVILLEPGLAGQPANVVANIFDEAQFSFETQGMRVVLEEQLRFFPPDWGTITFKVTDGQGSFGLKLRSPAWMESVRLELPDGSVAGQAQAGWILAAARNWKAGEQAVLSFRIISELKKGTHGNAQLSALVWGPLVLAYDQNQTGTGEHPGLVTFAQPSNPAAALQRDPEGLKFNAMVSSVKDPKPHTAVFVPFADAGKDRGRYAVWLPSPGSKPLKQDSLALRSTEDRSRPGNLEGSIIDNDPETIVVTFDGKKRGEDWYSITFDEPIYIREVTFIHGRNFHDGGWFEATQRKPRVEIRREPYGPWEHLGYLLNYPATTTTDPKGLKSGDRFAVKLDNSEKVSAVRVVGRPASGDAQEQSFSSCAEIEVR